MLFGTDHRIDTLLVGQARIFEQSKTELQCENTSHGGIDNDSSSQTGLHGLDRTLVELWRVITKSLPDLTASAAACT